VSRPRTCQVPGSTAVTFTPSGMASKTRKVGQPQGRPRGTSTQDRASWPGAPLRRSGPASCEARAGAHPRGGLRTQRLRLPAQTGRPGCREEVRGSRETGPWTGLVRHFQRRRGCSGLGRLKPRRSGSTLPYRVGPQWTHPGVACPVGLPAPLTHRVALEGDRAG